MDLFLEDLLILFCRDESNGGFHKLGLGLLDEDLRGGKFI